jgi:transposase InsO family protein
MLRRLSRLWRKDWLSADTKRHRVQSVNVFSSEFELANTDTNDSMFQAHIEEQVAEKERHGKVFCISANV